MQLKIIRFLITLLLTSFSCITNSLSQPKEELGFRRQLTFCGDNDILAFKGTDRYYTNGLFLTYFILQKPKGENVIKEINEWELGQEIFTAQKRQVSFVDELDRPIAAYLYGIRINSDWWGWIWDYQLKDEVGVNAHGTYAFSALTGERRFFQISPETNLTLGTSLTNITQSVLFQFGKFNQMHESGFWNSMLSRTALPRSREKELFFFYQPEVVYQLYNATIQGGLLRNNKGEIVSSPKSFVLSNALGVMTSKKRWTMSFQYVLQTREAKTQKDSHLYGRVKASYRFK
jgi:hypothetical protein